MGTRRPAERGTTAFTARNACLPDCRTDLIKRWLLPLREKRFPCSRKLERATGVEPATSSLGTDRSEGTTRRRSDGSPSRRRVFAIPSLLDNLWVSLCFPPILPEICQKSSTGNRQDKQ
jgi:hypothetical protein